MHKTGKILLITGTSTEDQLKVMEYFENQLNFVRLNQEKIFNKVVLDISDEYFVKDAKLVEEATGKVYTSYLDLLKFLQKTNIKKLSNAYTAFNRKVQLANEIIIFRLYKEYFTEAKQIIASGKNCIFTENIFNDPFPRRKDIFLDYFNYFGDKFKILNVYSDMRSCILQTKVANNQFISYISSKDNTQSAYADRMNLSLKGEYNKYRIENPLFNFELFPLMFNISSKKNSEGQIFELIKAKELQKIYDESVLEMKKIFGFIILKSYPTFYQKVSILNEIGSKFLYIKEFNNQDELFISNKRLIFDYNLILDRKSIDDEIELPEQLIYNINLWIQNKDFIYYNSSSYLTNEISKIDYTVKDENVANKYMSSEVVDSIKKLLPSDRIFIINDLNAKDLDDNNFALDKDQISKGYVDYYFFLMTSKGWVAYILLLNKNNNIKLLYYQNIGVQFEQSDENLIFINCLYINIHKIIKRHFFIDIVNLGKNARFNRKAKLEEPLNLLNRGHKWGI